MLAYSRVQESQDKIKDRQRIGGLFLKKHGDKIRTQCRPGVFPVFEPNRDCPTGTTSATHMLEDLAIFDFELISDECAPIGLCYDLVRKIGHTTPFPDCRPSINSILARSKTE